LGKSDPILCPYHLALSPIREFFEGLSFIAPAPGFMIEFVRLAQKAVH